MSMQERYLDDLDDGPDWSSNPQTPPEFERFHRWLYRGAFFFFLTLAVDAFVIFPIMILKFGWQ